MWQYDMHLGYIEELWRSQGIIFGRGKTCFIREKGFNRGVKAFNGSRKACGGGEKGFNGGGGNTCVGRGEKAFNRKEDIKQ